MTKVTGSQAHSLDPVYFALIIIIVVHVYSKASISIIKYIQNEGEPEDDAGFLKHIAS